MDTVNQAGVFLIQSLGLFCLLLVVLRLLLAFARADFYNPITQFVIKATQPAIAPLRRMLPPVGRIDTASVVLALLIQWITIQLTALVIGSPWLNPLVVLSWGTVGVVGLILKIYLYGLLAVIILSWVAPHSNHPAISLIRQMLEPVSAPFRRIIPPMGGLDLSPIFIFLVINLLQIFLHGIARNLMTPGQIVPGL